MMQNILLKMDHKIIYYFNHFLINLSYLVKVVKLFHGKPKKLRGKH